MGYVRHHNRQSITVALISKMNTIHKPKDADVWPNLLKLVLAGVKETGANANIERIRRIWNLDHYETIVYMRFHNHIFSAMEIRANWDFEWLPRRMLNVRSSTVTITQLLLRTMFWVSFVIAVTHSAKI